MSLQIAVTPSGNSRAEVLDFVQRAVDAGIDGLAFGDGMIGNASYPPWQGGLDPFVEIGWLAGRFDLSMYGTEGIVLPLRDPRIVAKQASSLAAVTDGRFHLGIVNGRWRQDADLFGYSFEERGARMDEGIRALQSIWRGDKEFNGQFWSWATDAGTITPCTSVPPPELWLAGEGAMILRRAVKYGLPWLPTRYTPADLAPRAHEYYERGGPQLKIRVRVAVAAPPGMPEDALTYPTLIGPAAYLAEQFQGYQEIGADYISVVPGVDYASAIATIDALAEVKRTVC
jgi:alkanesulfonate monooxygenase SsuD/methylene tetrahydromethanopterin reductase-like flavin-dependent oxidoreductase (luciferase family)